MIKWFYQIIHPFQELYKMALSALSKRILNKFSETAVALRNKDAVSPEPQQLPLGDVMDGMTQAVVDAASYVAVTATTGAVGAHALPIILPVGAIVTRLWTDEVANVTSGGSATVAISVGAQSLVAAQDFVDFVGAQEQALAAPVKITSEAALTLTVAVAALTGGKLNVYIEYMKPQA
jgi:hypothetical protein